MPAEQLNPLLAAALDYARRGLEVFPVSEHDKAPYTTNGMKDASRDARQIERWWHQHPHALIGCRIPEQFVILDIDPRHGGLETWREIESAYAPIPIGRRHHSGGEDGGAHCWFKRPTRKLSVRKLNDWARANGVGRQAGKRSWTAGIDILHHDHRYTILPPSPHPKTGRPYEWDDMGQPAPMPGYLEAMVTTAPTAPAQPMRVVRDADSIADWFTSQHSWHDILPPAGWVLVEGDGDTDGSKWRHPNASATSSASVRHGCLFVYTPNTDFEQTEDGDPHGITKFRAWAILEHDNDLSEAAREARERRDGPAPPLSTLIDSTKAVDPAEPWTEPRPLGDTGDRPAFPVDVLPSWVAAHVRQVADEMQFPPDLPAQLAITALSVVTAGRVRITVHGSWIEPLNTYLVTAMPPGAGKSPAFRQMLGCLDDWEAELIERSAPQRDIVETRRALLDKERGKRINAGDLAGALAISDELRELPDVTPPRLMADDATPEKLIDMLKEQRGRLALVSTEGGVFALMSGRYSDKANLDVYLQAWSGDMIRVDRIGRASSVIRNPALTIGLTVQPSVIADLADLPELTGRGLLARFMYSIPEDNVGHRDMTRAPAIDSVIAGNYGQSIRRLAERLHDANLALRIEPAALSVYHSWRQDNEDRRASGGNLRHMTEWTTKLESTVARLAGLLAVAEDVPVDIAIIERAIAVGRYWEAHARHAHDMWGGDPVVARAGKFLDWVITNQAPTITLRDVYAKALRRITPEDAIPIVELLVDNGWVRSLDGRPLVVGKRGVPSPEFATHPEMSHYRHNHARMRAMGLKTHFINSLSLQRDTGRVVNSAHGAHGAHDPSRPADPLPFCPPVDNREPFI